jgi:hypothetical protein
MKHLVILRHPYKGQPIELVWWGDDSATGRETAAAVISPMFAIALAQDLLAAAYTELEK